MLRRTEGNPAAAGRTAAPYIIGEQIIIMPQQGKVKQQHDFPPIRRGNNDGRTRGPVIRPKHGSKQIGPLNVGLRILRNGNPRVQVHHNVFKIPVRQLPDQHFGCL